MRFQRLDIPAFGPFTDFHLDLPARGSDFHILHGLNEAGKSSLLRAIKALLFGMRPQMSDNFIHEYSRLRVAAEIGMRDGRVHYFQRRKGSRHTLLDAVGQPLSDGAMEQILGVVDAAYFESAFGLGARQLREGAGELLKGQGRLGEALFSASLGGAPVDQVIRNLEVEAAAIFSGRARKRLRETLTQYEEHTRARKEKLLKPETWQEVMEEIEGSTARLQQLAAARHACLDRRDWLQRCRDAWPFVSQLEELQRQWCQLPVTPQLPANFSAEIREARRLCQQAVQDLAGIEMEIGRLQAIEETCRHLPAVLEAASVIGELQAGLGVFCANRQTLAARQAAAAAKSQQMVATCRDLGLDSAVEDLGRLRLTQPQFVAAQAAAQAISETAQALHASQERLRNGRHAIQQLQSQSVPLAWESFERLKKLNASASLSEPLAAGLKSRSKQVASSRRELESIHRTLNGASADFEECSRSPVPSRATLERFREEEEELKRQKAELSRERQKLAGETRQVKTELERLERRRALPSLDDLEKARRHRDHGWSLVLQDWKGGGASADFVAGQPLETAYPESVAAADAIADRLRQEAEAVAQKEEKLTRLRDLEEKAAELAGQAHSLDERAARWRELWLTAWQGCHLDPLTPAEMIAWREAWQNFAQLWAQWRTESTQLDEDRLTVQGLIREMAAALDSSEGDFAGLLEQLRRRIEDGEERRVHNAAIARQIEEAEREIAALQLSLPVLQETHAAALQQWENCRSSLALPGNLTPVAGLDLLRSRRDLLRDFDEWQSWLGECAALRETLDSYSSRAAATARQFGHTGQDAAVLVEELGRSLTAALQQQQQLSNLRERLRENEEDRARARLAVERSREEFSRLLAMTHLGDGEDLDLFLTHCENRLACQQAILEKRTGLANLARGEAVDDFIARLQAEDRGAFEGKCSQLAEDLAGLDRQIEAEQSHRAGFIGRRTEMEKAQDAAARADQEAQFAMAALTRDAERYARLRLAISLLQSQIDEFRRQNQGPFLEKASQWFAELTGGAFAGIETNFDEKDNAVMAGLRAGASTGAAVPLSGLSDGTGDQLFLALRLAGIEIHLLDHEPMPMILDDLLINFDDVRAGHALAALSRLGEKSQVLLFTHHRHLVQLAREKLGEDRVHLVEMVASSRHCGQSMAGQPSAAGA